MPRVSIPVRRAKGLLTGFTDSQIEFVFSEIHRVLRNNGLFLSCVRNNVKAISFFNKEYLYSKLNGFQVDSC